VDKSMLTQKLATAQRAEITEYHIYNRLSELEKDDQNRRVLRKIASDELLHYEVLKSQTRNEVKPDGFKVFFYFWLGRIFGITFALRLMEKGEGLAQGTYRKVSEQVPEVAQLEKDEYKHEQKLLDMLQEERLKYASSMVLGLNDALVELTGAIAGFTLALQNARLILLVSLVTGISAALSMAASEYLSTKTEEHPDKEPLKAALYTGAAYLVAVVILILPFTLMSSPYHSLGLTLINALVLIFLFTYYISVARGRPFLKAYLEMALISMGVAALSFAIGLLLREFVGVEI
jgi:VIT1/CCC1 family predicted Fe2+/Mn2+ transporter